MTLRDHLIEFRQDFVQGDNRLITWAWLASIVTVVGMGWFLASRSDSFQGIAESREYQITFERPVSVRQFFVNPGQVVSKGQAIVELDQSELETRIRDVRMRLDRLMAQLKLRDQVSSLIVDETTIDSPKGAKADDSVDPLRIEARDLKNEMQTLARAKENLKIFAQIDGVMGSINYKPGERVPAFATVATVLPSRPTIVQGFIHESLPASIAIGDEVSVVSTSNADSFARGRVVGLGSRIVAIPMRLARVKQFESFGREVIIELDEQNSLLHGERVGVIRTGVKEGWSIGFSSALAQPATNQ
jgi:multidrug resistance efflux pump